MAARAMECGCRTLEAVESGFGRMRTCTKSLYTSEEADQTLVAPDKTASSSCRGSEWAGMLQDRAFVTTPRPGEIAGPGAWTLDYDEQSQLT